MDCIIGGRVMDKVLIIGDMHLHSKNYGAHKNYSEESLFYFREITNIAEECGANYIIGTGDFTFGRFSNLEYRLEVDRLLHRHNELTNGNRYELRGNHDYASYGMTEYEFYLEKGLLKKSENLQIGKLNISMIDYNQIGKVAPIIEKDKINIIIAHDYLRFNDDKGYSFGDYIALDNMEEWFGADYIICGHIHVPMVFEGNIRKGNKKRKVTVIYPGCPCRPSYREGRLYETCFLPLIKVDNNSIDVELIEMDLWKLEDSFVATDIEEEVVEKQKEEFKVNISDIVQKLNDYEKGCINIEEMIMSLSDVDIRYRLKAVELLREGIEL